MGEKGNAAEDLAAPAASIMSRVTETSTTTVTQAADALRDKVVGSVADATIDEARDRLREARQAPPTEEQGPTA
jgi:hypothetical protein